MSAKKGREAKILTVPQDVNEKDPAFDSLDASNLSAIERASFLEAVQRNYGNPLHSTAMGEDLDLPEEERMNGKERRGKGAPKTGRPAATKQNGAKVQRKKKGSDGENKVKEEKRSRRSIGVKVKARSGKEGGKQRKKGVIEEEIQESDIEGEESDPGPAAQENNHSIPSSNGAVTNGIKRLVGKRSIEQKPAERLVKNGGMMKEKKRKRKSGSREPNGLQSQEESDSDAAQQKHRPVLSSSEATDEDTNWGPSQKKSRVQNLGRTRKSSSASGSAEPEETSRGQRKEKRRGRRGATELEEVLDAFLDFCDQYRESVESKTVRHAIESLSSSVKEQLTEKITASKELRVLTRDKAKVDLLIRKKRQRLLDAKYELMRAEQHVQSLQKEEARLALRLADLRRSQVFLRDIRDLNRQYLKHRQTHPKEKEKYGASSLPALLLETRHILGAEHQLRRLNNRLEKRLEENEK